MGPKKTQKQFSELTATLNVGDLVAVQWQHAAAQHSRSAAGAKNFCALGFKRIFERS